MSTSVRELATLAASFGLAIALLAAAGTVECAEGVALVHGSDAAPLPIVLRRGAIPAERTAAHEIATYLSRITGRPFKVRNEQFTRARAPTIEVGATLLAQARGVRCAGEGAESWTVATAGQHVVVCGSRPRGTLYAAYHLLEDALGVRWWTPFAEEVPSDPAPTVPRGIRRGSPAFVYRDINGVAGPREFGARRRLNGHFSGLRSAHGGSERYGPPSQVHNFFRYLPPEEHFDANPEFYSEIAGFRYPDRTQLCLTNDRVLAAVATRLATFIERETARAAAAGVAAPQLYNVSQNDWGRPCDCTPCRRLHEREGSHAAAVIAFVNGLAAAIAQRHPHVLLDTLAYDWSFDPPRNVRADDNVIVRIAPLYGRDFAKPLSAPVHEPIRQAVAGWQARTHRLRAWDYAVTYGDAGDLPRPSLDWLAADLRFYRDRGVEGIFVQQDPLIQADMLDLKRWVLMRLMEDPERDTAALVHEFTEGFYGAAAATMRRYRHALAEALQRRPTKIRFDADASEFHYLDAALIREAQALFDAAEALVEGEPLRLRRVRHARLALDAATLHRWSQLELAAELERSVVVERFRSTTLEQIELRLPLGHRAEARAALDEQLAALE